MLSREQPWEETDGKCTVGSEDRATLGSLRPCCYLCFLCLFTHHEMSSHRLPLEALPLPGGSENSSQNASA